MAAHLLFIGGEDHQMRLPFMLAMKAKGYRVTAAASCDPKPFAAAGVDFRPISFHRFVSPGRDIGGLWRLARLLREIDADLAHCFDTKLSLLAAFAARANPRTSLVRTINGRGWIFSSPSFSARCIRRIYPPLQRLAAASTSATIFEHREDYGYFAANGSLIGSEGEIIPGAGIDIEGFEAARARGPSPAALREELGLGDSPVVVTATRVTQEKGVPALLLAADIVHGLRPNVKVLIAGPREGEGPSAVPGEEFARRAGYVVAPGMRPDIPSILAMADIFVFPSEYAEGVPRAVMEAALCGLPIVATDIAGCREVIRHGWNGVLTPKGDPGALARAIVALLDDRSTAKAMGSRGPDVIRGAFSLEEVVARHAELYERQLAKAARRRLPGQAGRSDNDLRQAAP